MDGSNFEIRPASASEMPALQAIAAYAFANNETVQARAAQPSPLQPEWSLAAFDGDRAVASSGGFPFTLAFNGGKLAADGVTMVATDPGYRRRGILRQLMTGLLRRAHDNGQPASILWASMGAIYQRFGYGLGTTHVNYEIEPRYVRFQFGAQPSGHVDLLQTDSARDVLDAVYRQFIRPRTLMVQRAPLMWDLTLQRQMNLNTHAALYRNAHGEPRGYALYTTRLDETDLMGGQRMDVIDFGWLDMDAYRGLWSYLAGHDLVGTIRHQRVCEDDPAPNLLLEPRRLNRRTSDGIWLRVVDVTGMLSARGYDLDGSTVIGVATDAECPWNVGRYLLEVEDGEVSVKRTRRTAELEVSVQGLASLLCGHTRATELHRCGRIEARDQRRLPALDALFATRYRPALLNGF